MQSEDEKKGIIAGILLFIGTLGIIIAIIIALTDEEPSDSMFLCFEDDKIVVSEESCDGR